MENPLTALKVKCVEAGTNLTEVCARAGIARSTVDRWGKELPKTFQILSKLNKTIEQIAQEKEQPQA